MFKMNTSDVHIAIELLETLGEISVTQFNCYACTISEKNGGEAPSKSPAFPWFKI